MSQDGLKPEVDWMEVGREAQELELRHGCNAF